MNASKIHASLVACIFLGGCATSQMSSDGWVSGTPSAIARAVPALQLSPTRDELVGTETRIRCPALLGNHPLTSGRSNGLSEDCIYETETDDVIWAAGIDATSAETMLHLHSFYGRSAMDPSLTVEGPEQSEIGICRLEIWRIYNSEEIVWLSLRDLYAPSTVHQIRTMTRNSEQQAPLEALAESILQTSVQSLCEVETAN